MDELPVNVCSICLRKLLASNSFRKQCHASEYQLKKMKMEFVERKLINEIEAKIDTKNDKIDSFNDNSIEYIDEPDDDTIESVALESISTDSSNKIDYDQCETINDNNHLQSFQIELLNDEKLTENVEIIENVIECDLDINDIDQSESSSATDDVKSKRKKCPICGKWIVNLKPHMAIHEDIDKRRKPYKCQYCEKEFLQRAQFDGHVNKMHTGEKPFSCDECGKRFHGRPTLRMHKIQHSNKRRFVCEYCNKSYRYAHHLSHHRYTHTLQRLFHCKLCDYENVHPDNLKRHINKKHPELNKPKI